MENYTSNLFNYQRRKTIAVKVGNIEIGGENPIRVQSMANTDTNDTCASVEQAIRIEQAGGELVRFTAQGVKEANNLEVIHSQLRSRGAKVPLVADIHFNPKAAEVAALYVEKVRINPGNFVDRVHTLKRFEYSDEEYLLEIDKIRSKLLPLLEICKENSTAIRIGVNHGSLSDRILSRYGDTPNGMVESCLEFLRICREVDFSNVVISVKASNTVIMLQTVRLLVARMNDEGMSYPLHLGVTEAGDGEDGRVKSAIGIGALLADGLGDTIRVSLSEDPECEIPVAKKLVDYISSRNRHDEIVAEDSKCVNPFIYERRETLSIEGIGGGNVPVVIMSRCCEHPIFKPDYIVNDGAVGQYKIYHCNELNMLKEDSSLVKFLELSYSEFRDDYVPYLAQDVVLILKTSHINGLAEQRAFFHALLSRGIKNPVIIKRSYDDSEIEDLQIKAGADFGQFFIDGLGDGIWIDAPNVDSSSVLSLSFGILQGSRVRISKTEYISCPSCGRTLFDLQTTIARIKEKTSHLKNLKIGIMGCIVNGPGEMADADYGYVGSAKGMVNLYKGQTCVEKLIPEEQAVDKLIELIKENGDWID